MLRSVFGKTILERRWSTLLWAIGVLLMALFMMAFYHSFSGGNFDQLLSSLPKSLQGLVGNIALFKTVAGYVSQEVFALRVPLLTLIMGIVLFSGLLAGDENEGTLQTLLTQPVSRFKVFLQKYLAGLIISFVICAAAIVGVYLGLLLIHEQMSFLRLVQAVIGVWLLTVMCGTIGFSLGAITGKRGLSGSVAGIITFGSYLLTSFAPGVASLKSAERFSLFHFYNNPDIAVFGLKGSNVLTMVVISLILLAIAAFVFHKRDIYQR